MTVASTEADGCVIGRARESAAGADVTYCRDVARILEQSIRDTDFAAETLRSLGYTARTTIDGLVYALLTGGAFGWLWP